MGAVVVRPVWRRFRPKFETRAASHVRAGGHAVVVPEEGPIHAIVGVDARGRITELGEWAFLAIDHRRWRRVHDGPMKGLIKARVRPEYEGSVLDFCARDSVHPGPTRAIDLDCLECGACCHDANVIVTTDDVDRWKALGRDDLTSSEAVYEGDDGRVHLRFTSRACRHLGGDNACAIYELRPDGCRAFVMGSEACLAAREETLGLRDGAPKDD